MEDEEPLVPEEDEAEAISKEDASKRRRNIYQQKYRERRREKKAEEMIKKGKSPRRYHPRKVLEPRDKQGRVLDSGRSPEEKLARQREQSAIWNKERKDEMEAAKGIIELSESETPLDSGKSSPSARQDQMAKPSAAGRNPDKKSKGKSPRRYVQRNEYFPKRDKKGRFLDSGLSPEEKQARRKEFYKIADRKRSAEMQAVRGMINLSESENEKHVFQKPLDSGKPSLSARKDQMAKPSAAGRNPDNLQPLATPGTSQHFRQNTIRPPADAPILQEPNLKKKLVPGDPGYLPRGPFIYLPADTQQTLLQLARERELTEIWQKERRADMAATKPMTKLSESENAKRVSQTPPHSNKPSSYARQDKMAMPSAAGRNTKNFQPLAIAGTSQAFRQDTVSPPADAPTLQEPNLKNMQVPGDPVYQPRGPLKLYNTIEDKEPLLPEEKEGEATKILRRFHEEAKEDARRGLHTISPPADAHTLQEPNLKNMQIPGDPVYQPRGPLIDLPATYTVTTTQQSLPEYIFHTPNVNMQGYIEDVPPNFGQPSSSNIEPATLIYPNQPGLILDNISVQQEIPHTRSTKPCTSIAKTVREVMDDMLKTVACGGGKK